MTQRGNDDRTEAQPPTRKAVLDGLEGRERRHLADVGGRGPGRDDSDGASGGSVLAASRRGLLAAASTLGVGSLAGCTGLITGETAEFHAPRRHSRSRP